MDKRIVDCLAGNHGSYIFPFLWLHGESQERLYEEILAIKNSGIREFCAECRPYPNFCREQWWDDFGFILKTARELGMRVWLLDDRKFPTGYANGYLESPERAHLRKIHVREYQSTIVGPMKKAKIHVGGWLQRPGERIISVIAYRHVGEEEMLDYRTAIDLTDTLSDGMVCMDAPAGIWRVCATIETDANRPATDIRKDYIDMLNPESCRAMIDAIYQPHYEHFAEYFGNTFAGFFSDEPGFLNRSGSYNNTLGQMHEIYPWRRDLPTLIAESAGLSETEVHLAIPALWEDLGEMTAVIRMHYMEVVTKLYRDNFGYLLGNWCREHGVMYIGHVIEDNDAHMRLGYGSGHYFRALEAQDMAGIDIVLVADIPGVGNCIHRGSFSGEGYADPAFFRYTLPKLGASHSHIQPLKGGRAMCEIFGAFGWAEGLPYMKGLADIMLVGGLNHFVPHAFSPKEEDPDCPPHFYNGGKNIQYPLFKNLMDYMGRCSHVLTGAAHRADVAVFYNAEGEWTGGENQLFRHICKSLTRSLVDFDIVPYDILREAKVVDNRLIIHNESYGALVISKSEILPADRMACFVALAEAGLPVIFTEALPKRIAEGGDIESANAHFEAVGTRELADLLRRRGLCHVNAEGKGISDLRFYHVAREEADIYLFSNEAISEDVEAVVSLPNAGDCLIYDPWDNKCYRGTAKDGKLALNLEKGNLLIVVFGCDIPEGTPVFRHETERKPLPLTFDILIRDEEESDFRLYAEKSELIDLSAADRMPRFSGEVKYQTTFRAEKGYTVLDLGEVGETAEVWLNGEYLGARINAPYKFSLIPALQEGENQLTVVVKSNLGNRRRDRFSRFIQIPPTGIMGDIALCRYEDLY